MQKG
jgi:hypothetical protein